MINPPAIYEKRKEKKNVFLSSKICKNTHDDMNRLSIAKYAL
jgi:hypothetical protein